VGGLWPSFFFYVRYSLDSHPPHRLQAELRGERRDDCCKTTPRGAPRHPLHPGQKRNPRHSKVKARIIKQTPPTPLGPVVDFSAREPQNTSAQHHREPGRTEGKPAALRRAPAAGGDVGMFRKGGFLFCNGGPAVAPFVWLLKTSAALGIFGGRGGGSGLFGCVVGGG